MVERHRTPTRPEPEEDEEEQPRRAPRPGGIAATQLRSIVNRIERLEEEKKALSDDIKDVYAEAKANGYDTKVLRKVIRLRKQDRAERLEQENLMDVYLHALGMASEDD